MSFVYTGAKEDLLAGDLDFNGHDIRVALLKLKASTTADTDQDAQSLSGITTLGEISATNYARVALASEAVNRDDTNNRAEFDSTDPSFGAIGGAANDTIGAVLLYRHVDGTAANDVPIAYIDNAGSDFSVPTNGGTISITVDAEGWLQAT